jgi:hypothetical protein
VYFELDDVDITDELACIENDDAEIQQHHVLHLIDGLVVDIDEVDVIDEMEYIDEMLCDETIH